MEWSQDIFVFELTKLEGRLIMSDDKEGGILVMAQKSEPLKEATLDILFRYIRSSGE